MTCRKTKEWSNKKLKKFRLASGEGCLFKHGHKNRISKRFMEGDKTGEMSLHMGDEGPPLLPEKATPRVPEQVKAIGEIRKILHKLKRNIISSDKTTLDWRFFVYNVNRAEGKNTIITLDIEIKNDPTIFRKFTIHRYMRYMQGKWAPFSKELHNFGTNEEIDVEEFLYSEISEIIKLVEDP